MNHFKKTLLTFVLMLGAIAAFAQPAPLNVNNNTPCTYLVTAVAVDQSCQDPCVTKTICVGPFSSVQLPPCGGADIFWCNLQVTPADDDCQPCPNPPFSTVNVSAPNDPCAPFPQTDTGNHCNGKCDQFTVDYHSPFDADIH